MAHNPPFRADALGAAGRAETFYGFMIGAPRAASPTDFGGWTFSAEYRDASSEVRACAARALADDRRAPVRRSVLRLRLRSCSAWSFIRRIVGKGDVPSDPHMPFGRDKSVVKVTVTSSMK
jgi:hypothetical protein